MDTIGSLVDKLTIVNLKLWKAVDDQQRLVTEGACAEVGHRGAAMVFARLTDLNRQRNRLVEEIDQRIHEAVEKGAAERVSAHKT